MSVQQYERQYQLVVARAGGDGLDLSKFRIRFSVRRGDLQTPNTADIRVYNLSDKAADKIRQITPAPEFTRVQLQAGYPGNYGLIFDGQIKQVRRGRESQTDTYIDITAADGDSAYNYSTLALSLAAGQTSPANQVEQIIGGMASQGVRKGYIPALDSNPLPRGKVLFGMARDELRKLGRTTQTSWSIQDGRLTMVPMTAYMPGDIPVITSATGMIGLPEQTQNGIKIKSLLNPNLKIGRAVKLDNASLQQYRYGLSIANNQQAQNMADELYNKTNSDGLYYVMIADHVGDTRGNDWYTELTCLAIDASVSPVYVPRFPIGPEAVESIKRFG